MIRLSRTVAFSRGLHLYEDSEDPTRLYYMPVSAELDHSPDGTVDFVHHTFRSGGPAGTDLSVYRWAVRSVVSDTELADLAGEMAESRGHPVHLQAAPVLRMPDVSAGVSPGASGNLLLCMARPGPRGLDLYNVTVVARDSAEPALAEQLMGPSGLEVSLEFRVTGATTPFRGIMQANYGAVRRHLLTTFSETMFLSWSQVTGEVETLLDNGTIRLCVAAGAADSLEVVSAVSRQVINRLMLLQRHPPKPVPYPAMSGARFRIGEREEGDRWETVELTEFDVETRSLAMSSHLRSIPAEAFRDPVEPCEEIPPKLALHLEREGIHVGRLPCAAGAPEPRPVSEPLPPAQAREHHLHGTGERPAHTAGGRLSAPRANRAPLALVCATNDAFALSAAAMLHSVATHLADGSSLRVFILDDGVSPESRSRLERVVARFRVLTELVWLEPDVSSIAGFKTLPALPYTMYLRFQVGSLLPASLDRVIYLDTDIVVRTDLWELWETSTRGYTIGAVQNHLPSMIGEPQGVNSYRELGIDSSAPYFNSGLLLIDLTRWREEQVEERAMDYVRTHPDDLHFPDQEALNAVLAGRWRVLPPQWNVLPSIYALPFWPDSPLKRQAVADEWRILNGPKVVHFAGKTKPWMAGCGHPLKSFFLHHLRESGWEQA
ncbi:MAG TPA: glycosyltransferase family 8 protein [Longimicrobiaceae bacterium]|nr:glycosyltransferase family 8 protein [Longimicrobiaceae bacterium]